MLLQEFTKLTGFTPSEEYFNCVIFPAYMASGLGKEDWCKQWMNKGGVQAAYNAMAEELATAKKRLSDKIGRFYRKCEECKALNGVIMDLNIEIENYKKQVARLNDREVFIDTLNKFCN